MQLQSLAGYILLAVQVAVLVAAVYALIHAAMQRADAYTAVNKQTKPIWLAILGGAVLFCLLGTVIGLGILAIAIAACAVGVYLADVRPKILEVQGKRR